MISDTMLALAVLLSISSAGAQFYSDYGDLGGGIPVGGIPSGGGGPPSHSPYPLHPFEIPVIYKERTIPAAYPVAPVIYQVALMQPIEPMPGKKTVPLYMVPEDSLLVDSNELHSRRKRSADNQGYRVNIKYPQFYGLTDGYHIPAVEIPLNKPMVVRQIEVNVLAPEGFMVPFHSEDRQWPYPMTTGCLVAAIPRNTYVSEDHPITIRRLFAVPSLPEYPTYRPAFPTQSQSPYPSHGHSPVRPPYPPGHSHGHGHSHGDGVTLNFYQPNSQSQGGGGGRPAIYAHPVSVLAPQPKPQIKTPVFELVPVTPKSNRRNGKRRKNGKNRDKNGDSDEDKDRSEEEDEDNESKDSRENSDEDDRDNKRCRNGGSRGSRRNCKRNNSSNRNRDRDNDKDDRDGSSRRSTTQRTTTSERTSTTTPRTTTTTPSTTTPSASSIQDIIAAFSSYRDREKERDDRRNRISASFYEDEERERKTNSPSDRSRERGRGQDRSQPEGLRSGSPNSSRNPSRNRDRDQSQEDNLRDVLRDSSPNSQDDTPPPASRETPIPSENNIKELREQALQRQINQLQRLLGSLNIGQESANSNSKSSPNADN